VRGRLQEDQCQSGMRCRRVCRCSESRHVSTFNAAMKICPESDTRQSIAAAELRGGSCQRRWAGIWKGIPTMPEEGRWTYRSGRARCRLSKRRIDSYLGWKRDSKVPRYSKLSIDSLPKILAWHGMFDTRNRLTRCQSRCSARSPLIPYVHHLLSYMCIPICGRTSSSSHHLLPSQHALRSSLFLSIVVQRRELHLHFMQLNAV